MITDSRRLFDAVDTELPQDDRKSALEVPIIEEFMRRSECRVRWAPHNKNPADAMTKYKGAHVEPLLQLMRKAMYTLRGETDELKERKGQKELGTLQRKKVSAKLADPSNLRERISQSERTTWTALREQGRRGTAAPGDVEMPVLYLDEMP